jgi:PTS system cellobiose-specific IIB component
MVRKIMAEKNILIVCSGGMSSSLIERGLQEHSEKQGNPFSVKAVGTGLVKRELDDTDYSIILVAPQVRHQQKKIEEEADRVGVKVVAIKPQQYTPMGTASLYETVVAEVGE